jgi:hypothetical protein
MSGWEFLQPEGLKDSSRWSALRFDRLKELRVYAPPGDPEIFRGAEVMRS